MRMFPTIQAAVDWLDVSSGHGEAVVHVAAAESELEVFDYKELLRKYAKRVNDCEHTDFLSDTYDRWSQALTEDELAEVRRVCGWSADGKQFTGSE